jgi:hypothetical protein
MLRRGPEVRGRCLDICRAAMLPRRLAVIAFRRFAAYRKPPAFGGYWRLGASDTSGRVILRRLEGKEAQKGRVKGGKERRRLEDEERVDGG